MASITIGGETIDVALPNFKALKAAWGFISAVHGETDPMAGVSAILGVISVGAGAPVSIDELEERLTPAEVPGLRPFMNALMSECGLAPGEAQPAETKASPSTATSIGSSTS